MNGKNGIQMQAHPEFHSLFKELKNDRIKIGKERSGELSDKRFFLTIARIIQQDPRLREILINVDINKHEE